MSSPPNSYTTQAIWDLWLSVHRAFGSRVKLGGVYADKPGYHNTRDGNVPWNYSVVLPLDKLGPDDKSAAIDLTFSSSRDMKKYTARMKDAMKARDPRMGSVKEFYGTLDGENVYGLGKKSRTGEPYRTSADRSHLWHLHISIFRADVGNWDRIKGIAEVLIGAPLPGSGTASIEGGIMLPKYGDESIDVGYWQRALVAAGYSIAVDNDYGPKTKAAVAAWFHRASGSTYSGEAITSWIALNLQREIFRGLPGPKGDKGDDATVTGSITVNLETGKVSA